MNFHSHKTFYLYCVVVWIAICSCSIKASEVLEVKSMQEFLNWRPVIKNLEDLVQNIEASNLRVIELSACELPGAILALCVLEKKETSERVVATVSLALNQEPPFVASELFYWKSAKKVKVGGSPSFIQLGEQRVRFQDGPFTHEQGKYVMGINWKEFSKEIIGSSALSIEVHFKRVNSDEKCKVRLVHHGK